MSKPLYPDVKVQLTGSDGNAFMVIGLVSKAMRKSGLPQKAVDDFKKEAMSSDYNNLLAICMKYVDCD
jgi:hypothetical protein